jgi:hypothetical protein
LQPSPDATPNGRIEFVKRLRSLSLIALAVPVLLMIAGCGQFFPSSTTITSLQISPLTTSVQPGNTQQFTATATYGNNTTGNATSQVTWASSSTNIATISSGGLASGVALGSTTITCSSGSVSASTTLTVSNKTVTSVAVTPITWNPLAANQTQQFTAVATFTDSSTQDVTASATWASSSTNVATVSTTGLGTAVATGTSTISATYGGVSGNATVSW